MRKRLEKAADIVHVWLILGRVFFFFLDFIAIEIKRFGPEQYSLLKFSFLFAVRSPSLLLLSQVVSKEHPAIENM